MVKETHTETVFLSNDKGESLVKKHFFSLSIRSLMLLFCLPFVLLVLLSCSYFSRAGKEEITDLIQANAVAIIGQTSDTLEQKIAAVSNLPTTITASSYYYKLRKKHSGGPGTYLGGKLPWLLQRSP